MNEHDIRMTVYKLTDQHIRTYNGFQYEPGWVYVFSGDGLLCSAAWSHAYPSIPLAVLMNPIHAGFADPRLWECAAVVGIRDRGDLKLGCSTIRLRKELPLPTITPHQRIAFAIACAWSGASPTWRTWAAAWLRKQNRMAEAAAEGAAAAMAAEAAEGAAWAAASPSIMHIAEWASTVDAEAPMEPESWR